MALTLIDKTQVSGVLPLSGGTMTGSITFSPSTNGVVGTTTNNSATAGIVGEYIESLVPTSTNSNTSGQYADLTTISLTAGDWDVTAMANANINQAAAVTELQIGISTTPGNSGTGLRLGDTAADAAGTTFCSSNIVPLAVPNVRMSLSGTTTVYLKYFSGYSGSNPQYRARISARRVR